MACTGFMPIKNSVINMSDSIDIFFTCRSLFWELTRISALYHYYYLLIFTNNFLARLKNTTKRSCRCPHEVSLHLWCRGLP